jgi:hypothetical protein
VSNVCVNSPFAFGVSVALEYTSDIPVVDSNVAVETVEAVWAILIAKFSRLVVDDDVVIWNPSAVILPALNPAVVNSLALIIICVFII